MFRINTQRSQPPTTLPHTYTRPLPHTHTHTDTHARANERTSNKTDRNVPPPLHPDTREPGELASTGHVPGAINIPVASSPDSFHMTEEDFEDRFGRARPAKDAEVVFYCKAGVRSRALAGLARDAGWTRVGEYPGSWLDWVGKGGKVERS